jgi:hypothetical protein
MPSAGLSTLAPVPARPGNCWVVVERAKARQVHESQGFDAVSNYYNLLQESRLPLREIGAAPASAAVGEDAFGAAWMLIVRPGDAGRRARPVSGSAIGPLLRPGWPPKHTKIDLNRTARGHDESAHTAFMP